MPSRHPWLLTLLLLAACSGSPTADTVQNLDPLAANGKQLFTQNCAACHSLSPDTIVVGPSLAGVASRAGSRMAGLDARQYIEQSILKPDAYVVKGFSDVMPKDFGTRLSRGDLDAVEAFLLALK